MSFGIIIFSIIFIVYLAIIFAFSAIGYLLTWVLPLSLFEGTVLSLLAAFIISSSMLMGRLNDSINKIVNMMRNSGIYDDEDDDDDYDDEDYRA